MQVEIRLNERVRVKLSEAAKASEVQQREKHREEFPGVGFEGDSTLNCHLEDDNGWSTWYLWELFGRFGHLLGRGERIFESNIQILVAEDCGCPVR